MKTFAVPNVIPLKTGHRSVLTVERVQIDVPLGWSEEERKNPQPVEIDLAIQFKEAPLACDSDHLDQTVCYQELVKEIKSMMQGKEFRLIESLAKFLFENLKNSILSNTSLWVRVHKISPPIPEIKGGTSFSYGEWNPWSS